VSFVTLGKAGTKKRITDAQRAAKNDAEKEISRAQEKTKKTEIVLKKRVQNVVNDRDALRQQKQSLENKLLDAQGALKMTEDSRDEIREAYKPLEAENAILSRDLRLTKAFLGDLEKAASNGDADKIMDWLKEKNVHQKIKTFQNWNPGSDFGLK
jgi:uncharacterized protein (DUF3084 family)